MTTDNSRYKEAARNSASSLFGKSGYLFYINGFLAGASFAEKEAHNAAIDKVLETLNIRVEFGHLEAEWKRIKEELEKLKI